MDFSAKYLSEKYWYSFKFYGYNVYPTSYALVVGDKMLKLIYSLGTRLKVNLDLIVLNHMLKFFIEGSLLSKLPYPCLITKLLISQWVEPDSDNVKLLTSKLFVQPHSSRSYDFAHRDLLFVKDVIAKYDALLLKTLLKLATTSKELDQNTRVFKFVYSQLQLKLSSCIVDEDIGFSTKDEDD